MVLNVSRLTFPPRALGLQRGQEVFPTQPPRFEIFVYSLQKIQNTRHVIVSYHLLGSGLLTAKKKLQEPTHEYIEIFEVTMELFP